MIPFVPGPPPPGAMVESPARKIRAIAPSSKIGAARDEAAIAAEKITVDIFMVVIYDRRATGQ